MSHQVRVVGIDTSQATAEQVTNIENSFIRKHGTLVILADTLQNKRDKQNKKTVARGG